MTDLNELRKIAEAQAEAYRVMLLIGEGVGGLGVRHPERFESMLAWDDMSANGHADTVLTLLSRLEAAEKVIEDALSWMNTYDGLFTDHPLRRILSAYTKGADRD